MGKLNGGSSVVPTVRIGRLVSSLTVKDGEEPFMVLVNWLEMLRLPVRQH